ncbi:collagenase-like [Dermatophagoides farinae]|uniref:collagenase-like n=1 Tax=Dermatophagoides farinae TaxID=6954 RepID=UPI003F639945
MSNMMKISFVTFILFMLIGTLLIVIGRQQQQQHIVNEPMKNDSESNDTKIHRVRRVVGGEPTPIESFPWTVIVINKGRCGGVLIDTQWVLTAGHCIVDINPVVYFGLDHLSMATILNKRNVIEIYKPARNLFTTADLALLKLSFPVEITSRSHPIRMNRDRRTTIMGYEARMAGFGRNIQRNQRLLAGYFDLQPVFMFSSRDIIGARSQSHSPCYGDSGSGLIIEHNVIPYLVGITSSILAASCEPNHVALFTDVSFYYNWIIKKIGNDPGQRQQQQQQQQQRQNDDIFNDIPNDNENYDNHDDVKNFIRPPSPSPPPPPSLPMDRSQDCWPNIFIPWIKYKIMLCNSWLRFVVHHDNHDEQQNLLFS